MWDSDTAMSDEKKVRFITPPNTLRAKVAEGGPGAVTPEVLARAEKVIAGMTDSYVEWAASDLVRLEAVIAELKAAPTARHPEILKRIFHIAHDMKGQGGSFDYKLMTIIGDMLCRYVERLETASQAQVEVLALHLSTMQLVIAKQLKGDGGSDGAKLMRGLELVAAKRAI